MNDKHNTEQLNESPQYAAPTEQEGEDRRPKREINKALVPEGLCNVA